MDGHTQSLSKIIPLIGCGIIEKLYCISGAFTALTSTNKDAKPT